jgi:hypothetical protein
MLIKFWVIDDWDYVGGFIGVVGKFALLFVTKMFFSVRVKVTDKPDSYERIY